MEPEHPKDSQEEVAQDNVDPHPVNGFTSPLEARMLLADEGKAIEVSDSQLGNRSRKATLLNDAKRSSLISKDDLADDNLSQTTSLNDTEARFDVLARERAALRDEVSQLRKSLEEIRGKHEEELGSIREQLEDTQSGKEHAETQYRNLLGKVNTIKSQLGERLKADAVYMLSYLHETQLMIM